VRKFFLTTFLFTSFLNAGDFSVNPSFQGYSGLINTPNAQVIKEGDAVLSFNNQFDNSLLSYDYDKKHSFEENYIVGFGFFSFLEVQGRVSEASGYHRDLSANIKFQLPYHNKYLPDLAIGMQDLGGAANQYDNQYIVMDKELWFLRASLGYGHSTLNDESKKRMDGVFGGIEIKATDWLYLMAEDDANEQHVALRLEMPKSWLSAFNLRATVAQNLKSDDTSFNFVMNIPLFHESKIQKEIYQKEHSKTEKTSLDKKEKVVLNNSDNTYTLPKTELRAKKSRINSLSSFQNRLVDFGFENVRVAKKNDTIYVEFENSIFDHTDLDALGYVIGTLSKSDLKSKYYQVILLKNSIQTISIKGDIKSFKNYIENPSFENEKKLLNGLSFSRSFDDKGIIFSKLQNSSFFKPRASIVLFCLLGRLMALRT